MPHWISQPWQRNLKKQPPTNPGRFNITPTHSSSSGNPSYKSQNNQKGLMLPSVFGLSLDSDEGDLLPAHPPHLPTLALPRIHVQPLHVKSNHLGNRLARILRGV